MIPPLAQFAMRAGAAGAAALLLARQCRKPTWWPGRLFALSMNASHAGVTRWGLSHVSIQPTDTILDVGCGGGRAIGTMAAAAAEGRVLGVDYSAASVSVARRVNANAIAAGRVDVQKASVSALPFSAETFDLVTAVETPYYWPDLVNDLKELRRVLKPGGRVVLIAETYRGRRADWLYGAAMRFLRGKYLTPDEHVRLLEAAGYVDVGVHEERSKGWLCAVGRRGSKASSPAAQSRETSSRCAVQS